MPASELRAYAHAMILSAAVWDVLGALNMLPPWWPPVSYVVAAVGIVAACLSALFQMFNRRTPDLPVRPPAAPAPEAGAPAPDAGAASPGGSPAPAGDRSLRAGIYDRGNVGVSLLAVAVLLGAWLLRGHAEIPPDAPLVAAEVLGAVMYALAAFRVRKRGRPAPM